MKNKFWGTDILLLILSALTVIFGTALGVTQPRLIVFVAAGIAILIFVLVLNAKSARKLIKSVFYGSGKYASAQQISFENLAVPVAIVSKDTVVWYNESFKSNIFAGIDNYLAPWNKILPSFDIGISCTSKGQAIQIKDREFTIYSSYPTSETNLWVSYFVDDTQLKFEAKEYKLTRPVVMQIAVDTYDDVLKELKESQRAQIMAKLDQLIEDISQVCNGLSMKVGTSRYHIIIEERYFGMFYDSQFDILAKVRAIDEENSVTLSIGVGKSGADFAENDLLSRQALDMALGRGGDQAVIKTVEGYEFFGGTSRGVEKRSKVRSRIVAKALRDIIMQSGNVVIMGHKMSDLDSVGAAVGVAAAVKSFERKANIIVDENKTLAGNLINWVKQDACMEGVFVPPEKASGLINEDTLLIVVDTHVARMTECEDLCKQCDKKVIIDHHRRMVDYITDTVVSYHEPYASSASELVTELIQYILPTNGKLTPRQAGALLSGIMLDTRNFSEKAGVRTFEAAAYLRRQSAEPSEILKLFAIPKDIYMAKASLVNSAENYKGIAISVSDKFSKELQLAVPQAANDLLMLEGVDASVVAMQYENDVNVSARSLGEVNVQVLMEYLGGGGHLTMAGVQLKNTTLEQAR
ncbi:MAG: DHH family phosphoesterase, partial [Oscillospiraceae bacterium]